MVLSLIKNIVFDIGNVLLYFKPLEFLEKHFGDGKLINILIDEIFKTKEWLMLDRGTITEEEATKRFCQRNPQYEKPIKKVMESWKNMLTPIESSVELFYEIKKKGYNTYILSNYQIAAFDKIYKENDFFREFDGMVISAKIKLLKPEREIYEYLLEKFQLNPKETLFIDDSKENILAAKKLGIDGIYLKEPSILRQKLEEKNIL